jgi:hypothetical protein
VFSSPSKTLDVSCPIQPLRCGADSQQFCSGDNNPPHAARYSREVRRYRALQSSAASLDASNEALLPQIGRLSLADFVKSQSQ